MEQPNLQPFNDCCLSETLIQSFFVNYIRCLGGYLVIYLIKKKSILVKREGRAYSDGEDGQNQKQGLEPFPETFAPRPRLHNPAINKCPATMISEPLLRDSGGSVIAASSSDRFSHLDFFPHPNPAASPHESQQTAPAPLVLSVGITQPAARRPSAHSLLPPARKLYFVQSPV